MEAAPALPVGPRGLVRPVFPVKDWPDDPWVPEAPVGPVGPETTEGERTWAVGASTAKLPSCVQVSLSEERESNEVVTV